MDRNVKQTVKHGGGRIMVWGCITPQGTGRLHLINGNMNAEQYCQILEESLLGTLRDYEKQPSDINFQQDGDPKHTSKLAHAWLASHHIDIAAHLAQSPDMNPIKHAWDYLDHQIRARYP